MRTRLKTRNCVHFFFYFDFSVNASRWLELMCAVGDHNDNDAAAIGFIDSISVWSYAALLMVLVVQSDTFWPFSGNDSTSSQTRRNV